MAARWTHSPIHADMDVPARPAGRRPDPVRSLVLARRRCPASWRERLRFLGKLRRGELMDTTAKVEIVDQPVIRLTIELPTKHAAELAGLLAGYVSFLDFPWAGPIWEAL